MTKYYVDTKGNYLGGYDGKGAEPPKGSVEVSGPPNHGHDKFINGAWVDHTPSKQSRINKAERKITMRYICGAIRGEAYALAKLQEIEDEIKAIR